MIRPTVFLGPVLALACTPEFDDTPWRVEEPRVLAIAASPPEARPGDPVMLTALVASPDGPISAAPQWSVCTRPRSSAERTSVTQGCLEQDFLEPTTASMTVLPDACARFGPNPPPIEGDSAPQRPADPDPSGGYFLPLRAASDDAEAFGAIRIRCDLPGVTRAIFDAFEDRYVANEAPQIAEVLLGSTDPRSDTGSAGIDTEAELEFTVRIPSASAEPYVRYDSDRGVLVDEREWIRVQWFVTDGRLAIGQDTLRASADADLVASTSWATPPEPTTVHGWVVVTDARGAMTWDGFTVEVGG